MARQKRLDFPGAIHLVSMHGHPDASIFFDADILQCHTGDIYQHAPAVKHLEELLAHANEEYDALIHAYVVMPNAAMIVIQTGGAPLEWIMRDLRGQYARYLSLSRSAPKAQTIFQSRYTSKIIAPMYFPYAVRRVHRAPIEAGLCQNRNDYPFSSNSAYCRKRFPPWLSGNVLIQALGRRDYAQFMDSMDTAHIAKLFAHGWPRAPSIVGNFEFVTTAQHAARAPHQHPSRKQLIEAAAKMLHVSTDVVSSQTHKGALARALVAGYALRTGAATRAEVGRWFGVTGSALRHAIRHHRKINPD